MITVIFFLLGVFVPLFLFVSYRMIRGWPILDAWEYGWCGTSHARRNRFTGDVQFLLWKPGEQGHAKGMWHRFGSGHETDFFAWEEGNVIQPHLGDAEMKKRGQKERIQK